MMRSHIIKLIAVSYNHDDCAGRHIILSYANDMLAISVLSTCFSYKSCWGAPNEGHASDSCPVCCGMRHFNIDVGVCFSEVCHEKSFAWL